jgi:hypothetical protein
LFIALLLLFVVEAMQPRQPVSVAQHANAPDHLHVARAPFRLPAHFKVGDEITVSAEPADGNAYVPPATAPITGGRIFEIAPDRTWFSYWFYFKVMKDSAEYHRMNKMDNRMYTTTVRTYMWNKSIPLVAHLAVNADKHYSAGCEDFMVIEVDPPNPPGFGPPVAADDESEAGSDGYIGSDSEIGSEDEEDAGQTDRDDSTVADGMN